MRLPHLEQLQPPPPPTGRRLPLLDGTPFRIGRNADSEAVVHGEFISRDHASLRKSDSGGWVLRDLSRNGVFIAGSLRLKPNQDHTLTDGDEIRLGGPGADAEAIFRFVHPSSGSPALAGGVGAGDVGTSGGTSGEAGGGTGGTGGEEEAGGEEMEAAGEQTEAGGERDGEAEAAEESEEECTQEDPELMHCLAAAAAAAAGAAPASSAASDDLDDETAPGLASVMPFSLSNAEFVEAARGVCAAEAAAAAAAAAEEEERAASKPVAAAAAVSGTGGAGAAPAAKRARIDCFYPDAGAAARDATGAPAPGSPVGGSSTGQSGAAAAAPSAGGGSSRSHGGGVAAAGSGAGAGRLHGFSRKPSQEARALAEADAVRPDGQGELGHRFGAPPFSVLNSQRGYWKERRHFWEGTYNVHSEEGRGDNLIGYKGLGGEGARGTSVFCPVLSELCCRWWCPAGGTVLDPFAGGSVRGVVAGWLGLRYVGLELRREQIARNREQAARAGAVAGSSGHRWRPPEWVEADARELADGDGPAGAPRQADFVFSCPPYFDLEQYSDDPRDLSRAHSYATFLAAYEAIIAAAAHRLKPRRFACFVVGEIRDGDGFMRNFVGDTVSAFQKAGCRLYNSCVMLLPFNTLPVRAGKAMASSAKLGMCHQHVLVFYNGRNPAAEVKGLNLANMTRPLEWE
ncbi:hypothetical protein EMIHUDRAFT_115516 [Emiliania huxleyi CCMP1516]|uniref:FHA domain-containing protein n=2 Tax=Emiliania huxleyi TaxID=2903 RepID=A0A0D3JPH0_EMIH1|nr:hypothetical protein EMIHUDRAFT_115516 [Emiliania huxleyi CCMP1516]EOD25405.1 hypothetical protein EMIHUDRAFT_115516 [Emiliania huxleyi CCMP1516]|eukprot:XP_005777834.1 hypothetical protein EMIHUDRAFT_115516 [Emiliania huxleyi CCMP1516]